MTLDIFCECGNMFILKSEFEKRKCRTCDEKEFLRKRMREKEKEWKRREEE